MITSLVNFDRWRYFTRRFFDRNWQVRNASAIALVSAILFSFFFKFHREMSILTGDVIMEGQKVGIFLKITKKVIWKSCLEFNLEAVCEN